MKSGVQPFFLPFKRRYNGQSFLVVWNKWMIAQDYEHVLLKQVYFLCTCSNPLILKMPNIPPGILVMYAVSLS